MSENIFYVYEHWRPDKDQCFYVGFGKGYRSGAMRGRNPFHSNIVKKLKKNGLRVHIKKILSQVTREEAVHKEIERIAYWRSLGITLTNLTDGGDGIHNVAEESRRRISESKKGKKYALGVKRTDSQKSAISARMKGNKIWLGREVSASHRLNLSLANKGKHFLNNREKSVICLDDGQIFPSVAMAARNYNVKSTTVSQVCGGYKHRKTAGGLRFKYKDAA